MDDRREHIEVWHPPDVPQIELRRGFGVAAAVPRHWHDEYQLCLIQRGAGELVYRGRDHPTPPASLFMVVPGEVHSNRAWDHGGCSYRSMFIDAGLLREAAEALHERASGPPFLPTAVVRDEMLIARYLRVHAAFENASSRLQRQAMLSELLVAMVTRYAERPAPAASRRERSPPPGLRRAHDYLSARFADNVTLDALAGIAGLSPFHFSRVFAERYGMPPHAYQTQLRVARAKVLLREGRTIADTAQDTGFVDQSHFTRQFKRLAAVTPGRYAGLREPKRKNVQDEGRSTG